MADPAPATPAAPTAAPSPVAQQAQAAAQAAEANAQTLAQANSSMDDAWSKAVAAEQGVSLEDGRGRDAKGRFQKDDGAPKENAAQASAPADDGADAPAEGSEAQDAPAPTPKKAAKFAQAVREKARQAREQQAQRQRLEAENQRLAQTARQAEQDRLLAQNDPVAYLRSQGRTPEEISRILLNSASDGSPEGDLKALRQEIAELKDRERQRELAAARQRQEQSNNQNWRTFMDNQGSNAQEYPLMAATPEPFVQFAAQKVAEAIVADGAARGLSKAEALAAYDDTDFADGIELWLQNNRRQARAAAKGDNGTGGVERASKAPAPRTATPQLRGRRHVPPADFKNLSLDKQDSALDDMWQKSRTEEDVVKR